VVPIGHNPVLDASPELGHHRLVLDGTCFVTNASAVRVL
jgi:hypothetical protein